MSLCGQSWLGWRRGTAAGNSFQATDPAAGLPLEPVFHGATLAEADAAAELAGRASMPYARLAPARRAEFLRAAADAIEALGAPLLERARRETGLTEARLTGERARTCAQLRMFAAIAAEGSWVDARIDHGDPRRQPPKPDLRSLRAPIGPVLVFSPANFPLAYSVAGGDTASALAAGNPVVTVAHYAHPGTAEFVAGAVIQAAQKTGMPEGVFSMLLASDGSVGERLARDPRIKAGAFTGSFAGGAALHRLAQSRPDPIPFFAEMGSLNPVFLFPGALAERGPALAETLAQSVLLAAGQFCTSPGLLLVPKGEAGDHWIELLVRHLAAAPAGVMLHAGIWRNYVRQLDERARAPQLQCRLRSGQPEPGRAPAAVFETSAAAFLAHPEWQHEIFGPAFLIVRYSAPAQLHEIGAALAGSLTAALWAAAAEQSDIRELAEALSWRAGRLIYNGVPTGLEVGPATVHGGPWPAASDPRFTSVGGRALERFTRLAAWQDFPDSLLPEELQEANPRQIPRLVDGRRMGGE